jgi:hypothetical protein
VALTGFNRARRLAAEKSGRPFEEISYDEAVEILKQPALEQSEPEEKTENLSDNSEVPTVDRDSRIAELKAGTWETLRDLLKGYNLPTAKPKGVSWDEWAIPQILEHEGL